MRPRQNTTKIIPYQLTVCVRGLCSNCRPVNTGAVFYPCNVFLLASILSLTFSIRSIVGNDSKDYLFKKKSFLRTALLSYALSFLLQPDSVVFSLPKLQLFHPQPYNLMTM